MRIISGSAGGRRLAGFSGKSVRPTPDRVREAVFSILTSRIGSFQGLRILDLFAGTGAQGLEALSRGAAHAVFVDRAKPAIEIITENIARCRFREKTTLLQRDVVPVLPQLAVHAPFALIFLDPPYNRNYIPQVVEKITALQLLDKSGIICAESAKDETIAEFESLTLIDRRIYGITQIALYAGSED